MDQYNSAFITAKEAIDLIQSHTNDDPIVDLNFLIVNREYIEKGGNFTIKLVKKKNGIIIDDGVLYVEVKNDSDKYLLLDEIKAAYKRNNNIDLNLDLRPTKEITTIVDPNTNPKGTPMLDTSNDTLYMPTRDTRIA